MRILKVVLAVLVVVAVAVPSLASDPASQDGNVPSTAGEEVVLTWTGQTLPGAEQSGECGDTTSDVHEVALTVPAGTYDAVQVAGLVAITYDGPTADLIVTVELPDGTRITGDSGFVDTDESVSFGNPAAGTLRVLVCAFAGANPQAYDGTLTLSATQITDAVSSGPTCLAPADTLKFEMDYIDTTRAGGEPITETLEDGTLLWGSHAGTTHFFGPAAPDETTAAFIENYQGQTYQYFSADGGETWEFVSRTPIDGVNLPAQGFSDPVFTVDQAGNVFISEINLANVAISKSTDNGRSYTLQNLVSFVNSDRQWMAADEEDVVYMTANAVGSGGAFPLPPTFSGHFVAKSVDGGQTFIAAENPNVNGIGDIQVDFADGTLYELQVSPDGTIGMGAFRQIRHQESGFEEGFEIGEIATGGGWSAINRLIDPTFDMDDEGNLYTVWSENGTGAAGRPPGIYYSYSTDRGRTWHQPAIRVDLDARTDIWPWIAVGAPGQVAISYLQVDAELENNNAELATDEQGWNVITAHTSTGLGCGDADLPGWQHTTATSEPIHYGTICQGGTLCQAEVVDRRLGDYFANEIDGEGNVYISVSDTREGGAVSLPLVVRQVEGHDFLDPAGGAVLGCGIEPGEGDAPAVRRLAADDPVTLATQLAGGCVESAELAVIARDDVFADALAGGGLAGALDAPMYLTATDGLDPAVAPELARLGVDRAVLLGGTAALSAQVAADLDGMGIAVERIGGAERFATAALIAGRVAGDTTPEAAMVALGARADDRDAWPDAVASGVLSAQRGLPVLLATPEAVPAASIAALTDLLGEGGQVFLAGGTEAIGEDAEAQLVEAGFSVTRLAGETRYGTSAAVVAQARAAGAGGDLLVLATGEAFQAPLVGAPAAVQAGGVMLLVPPTDTLPEELAAAVADLTGITEGVLVLGDEDAVPASLVDDVVARLTPEE